MIHNVPRRYIHHTPLAYIYTTAPDLIYIKGSDRSGSRGRAVTLQPPLKAARLPPPQAPVSQIDSGLESHRLGLRLFLTSQLMWFGLLKVASRASSCGPRSLPSARRLPSPRKQAVTSPHIRSIRFTYGQVASYTVKSPHIRSIASCTVNRLMYAYALTGGGAVNSTPDDLGRGHEVLD